MQYSITKDNRLELPVKLVEMIAELERRLAELKNAEADLKEKLLKAMEENGVIKLDNDTLAITYVASTNRETLNGKKLREEHPDIYDEYIEIKPVKASVRIKVK